MTAAELIHSLQKNEPNTRKLAFDKYYSKLGGIAARYSKSQAQAEEVLNAGFHNILNKIQNSRRNANINLDEFMEKEFIKECIAFIKNIRSEYYVSSTVYASGEAISKNYNLFETIESIDYNSIDNELLIKSLQQLVPSQRLIFNLHVIDGLELLEAAQLLESSEGTVKSNLEKARYNLQKHIEKSLKTIKA